MLKFAENNRLFQAHKNIYEQVCVHVKTQTAEKTNQKCV